MENRTNKVIELEDGKEYIILRQILYKDTTYYVTGEVINDGEDFDKNLTVLKETTEGNDIYVEIETDPKVIKIIMENIK